MMTWKDMKLEKAIRLIKIEEEDELELVMRQLAVCLDYLIQTTDSSH